MAGYTRGEAREWAREKLVGVVNCTIPSFTGDLKRINEKAIRHDTRLAIAHGFAGTLGVSEVAIALAEYLDFLRIIVDEAKGRLIVTHHASWSNLEENIEAVRGAEAAGAEFVLLSYPPNFYPESEQDIYDYTKAVCEATNLAVMLFPMFLWGFSSRIHPSDIPVALIRRLIDDCPNVAAVKAEGGFPSIQSVIECDRLFGKEVVISMPIEGDLIPLSQIMKIQLSAASDHEYYGPVIPKVFNSCATANTTRRRRSIGSFTLPARSRTRWRRCCTAAPSSTGKPGNSRVGCRATTADRCASQPSGFTIRRCWRYARASSTPPPPRA
jgi:4-hydroxy-tetrahydrodipicolinate synthase